LKILRENDFPWDETTICAATKIGQLKIVKWAVKNGCPVHKHVYGLASKYGQLKIIKWLKKKNI